MSDKRLLPVSSVLLLAAAGAALVFILGRGIETRRDAAWQEVAGRLHGTFRAGPSCRDLDRFGVPAPWAQWASDGELHCLRVIEGTEGGGGPWALVQVRYSVRQRRGEEQPDAWYEVTVAVLQRPAAAVAASALVPAAAPDGYIAMHNGASLFVWKKGTPGAGASLGAEELPTLLEQARRTAAR